MKKKFFWIGALLTLVLVVVFLAYSSTSTNREAAGKLDDLRTEARRMGMPVTMDEVPASGGDQPTNAAPLVYQAMERVAIDKRAATDLLVEAAKRQTCTFEWDMVATGAVWSIVKIDVLLLALFDMSDEDLKAGDKSAFQRQARAAMRVSRMLADSPTSDAFLRSVEAERSVLQWLGKKMIENPGDEFVMSVVQRETFEPRPIPSLLVALRRFFAQGNEVAQNREIDGDQRVSWIWSKGEFPADPWGRDAVEATHLENAMDLYQGLTSTKTWPEAMDLLESTADGWSKDTGQLYYTLRDTSAIRGLARKAAENEAARRIIFVSAGMFKHRMAYKQFPDSSPIKGEMQIDPFANKPCKLLKSGTGFLVYSIGSDRFDSSGPVSEGLSFVEDIGFRLKAWPSP